MTARYLVTGCAGFIGARVSELLLDDGHQVTGVDSLNDAYDVRLKHWRLERLTGRNGFTFARLDICDRKGLEGAFVEKPDAVINLAARAGVLDSVKDPWVYYETNVTGALNLLEMCREHGAPKFIQASTSGLYGSSDHLPFREDASTDEPLSPYAASKKASETLCYTYHHLHGIDVTVLRYFSVYGPAGRPQLSLFRFVQWIAERRPVIVYGDGGSRDFTYVDDIARGTVAALKPVGFEIVNLGSDSPTAVCDVLRMLEDSLGEKASVKTMPRHPADIQATWADIGKAKRLLGWMPQMELREGVEELTRWYLDNRTWARDVSTV